MTFTKTTVTRAAVVLFAVVGGVSVVNLVTNITPPTGAEYMIPAVCAFLLGVIDTFDSMLDDTWRLVCECMLILLVVPTAFALVGWLLLTGAPPGW